VEFVLLPTSPESQCVSFPLALVANRFVNRERFVGNDPRKYSAVAPARPAAPMARPQRFVAQKLADGVASSTESPVSPAPRLSMVHPVGDAGDASGKQGHRRRERFPDAHGHVLPKRAYQ